MKPVACDLNEKQKAFCREYIVDFNATQAAIRAGYTAKNARTTAAKMLAKPNIQAFVGSLINERAERTEITADWVLKKAVESFEFNANPVPNQYGNMEMTNATAASRFLEMVGKHTAVNAFGKEDKGGEDGQPLSINFTVNDPRDKVEITRGGNS
ncbi:terminase small subunit [Idiomarinaceae phage Phi1M2-2]|uniref:terminase small subunit n=1 Tax=Idiomarinaceae phage Phi1M2-2 TaxID=1527515 RepID=UPI0004F60982|nr:terminase small subunit [Idiomarinaceae phage Phi1M2-2]AIM40759.1 putative small terminase [Idiomarinaceae phage Phi1M2-2]